MISQKRKQPGASSTAASQKRARFTAGLAQHGSGRGSGRGGGAGGAGDIEGDLDLDEQDRKRSQQGRKGRVVTEGYDSDESAELAVDDEDIESDDDDEDDGPPDKGKGKAADDDDDDDDDMFAAADGAEDEDKPGASNKKKKKKGGDRFLKSSEIEGQEFGTTTKVGDGDQDEALSDEDDEDRDFDLELEDDEGADNDDAGSLADDYNARAERTPTPVPEDVAAKAAAGEVGDPEVAKLKEKIAKARKGMGHKLDSFNMRAEMQSGRFDEDGNYVTNSADPHAQHDSWLEGNYSRKKIRAAREAQKKRDQEAEQREKLARAGGSKGGVGETGAVTEVECTVAMLERMERGESVLETLQRLGKAAKAHSKADAKKKGSTSQKAGKYAGGGDAKRRALALDAEEADAGKTGESEMDVDPTPSEAAEAGEGSQGQKPAQAAPKKGDPKHPTVVALEQFTALASELMSTFGHINIYDETYEGILRALRRKGAVPAEWDPAKNSASATTQPPPPPAPAQSQSVPPPPPAPSTDTRQFIYRWAPAYLAATQGANAAPDVETYGPFPVADLQSWAASGYFGAPGHCERILVKEAAGAAGAQSERWKSWSECGL